MINAGMEGRTMLQITISTRFTLGAAVLIGLAGCGAEIRPDGPKRVVYTDSAGAQRVVEVPASGELREAAIDRLIEMSTDLNPQVRANAIEALSPVTERVEPIVALSINDPNPGVRAVAAMVAGKRGLASLAPSVRGLLSDSSPFVRASALYALASFGEEVDLTELSRMLLEHENSRVRSQAAFVLGELGDRSAIPLLQQAAVTPVPNASTIERRIFRLQIAEALYKLGFSESIDTIRAALYPSRADELEATALAVQIIGEVQDETSIDQLIFLSDPEVDQPMPAEVRLGVAQSLAEMGYREGSFVAMEYMGSDVDAVRAQAASVLGKTEGAQNLGHLELLLANDPSGLVQVAAAGGIVDYTQRQFAQSR
jgi:HEAT repeat protein